MRIILISDRVVTVYDVVDHFTKIEGFHVLEIVYANETTIVLRVEGE